MLPDPRGADRLIADKGYDRCAARFREASIRYDADLYKQRNRIARMFVRLKGWRRIATRYDRSAHTVMSAIRIPATGIFWL